MLGNSPNGPCACFQIDFSVDRFSSRQRHRAPKQGHEPRPIVPVLSPRGVPPVRHDRQINEGKKFEKDPEQPAGRVVHDPIQKKGISGGAMPATPALNDFVGIPCARRVWSKTDGMI